MLSKLNIYIVDDYYPMVSTLSKLFEILEHESHFETSAEKAMSFCLNPENIKECDYILLDIFLNGINGIDIFQEIEKHGFAEKVVFVSGCDSKDETFKQAVQTGRPVVSKGFNPKDLIVALENGKIEEFAKSTHTPSVQVAMKC